MKYTYESLLQQSQQNQITKIKTPHMGYTVRWDQAAQKRDIQIKILLILTNHFDQYLQAFQERGIRLALGPLQCEQYQQMVALNQKLTQQLTQTKAQLSSTEYYLAMQSRHIGKLELQLAEMHIKQKQYQEQIQSLKRQEEKRQEEVRIRQPRQRQVQVNQMQHRVNELICQNRRQKMPTKKTMDDLVQKIKKFLQENDQRIANGNLFKRKQQQVEKPSKTQTYNALVAPSSLWQNHAKQIQDLSYRTVKEIKQLLIPPAPSAQPFQEQYSTQFQILDFEQDYEASRCNCKLQNNAIITKIENYIESFQKLLRKITTQ